MSAAAALIGLLVLVSLVPGPARANEQRRNTPSFGFQYGYGAMNGTGEMIRAADFPAPEIINRHQDFRWGGALGARIRYSLDQSHAVGVSFEDLRYTRKAGLGGGTGADQVARQLQVNTFFIDYLVYIARRARSTPYLVIGAGLHRDTFRFQKYENQVMAIAPSANLGVGVEYFVRPAWSIDATLRGEWFGQRGGSEWKFRGSSPVASSLQLGFQHYLLK